MRPTRRQMRILALGATAAAALLALYPPGAAAVLSVGARWSGVWTSLWRSCLLALATGLVATALGAFVAFVLWEGASRRVKPVLQSVVFVTAGIPSVVVALVVLLALPRTATLAQIAIALSLSTAPYAARYMLDDLNRMPTYAVDALHALGAGGPRTILTGILPYARPSILSTLLYTCARAVTEVAIFSLLCGADHRFLTYDLACDPLAPGAYPTALLLCALAMLLFERARSLQKKAGA